MSTPMTEAVAAELIKQLQGKIKSKMEVAKFFAGFLTFLTGFLLDKDFPKDLCSRVGILFLVASIGLCVAAVFAFDRLLMPKQHWSDTVKSELLEDFEKRLHCDMIYSWRSLFTPAVICFGVGSFLILLQVLDVPAPGFSLPTISDTILVALLLAAFAFPIRRYQSVVRKVEES